jgi:hypothetical protein
VSPRGKRVLWGHKRTAVEDIMDIGPLSLLFQMYRFGGSCLRVYRRNGIRKPEIYDASTLTKNRITG